MDATAALLTGLATGLAIAVQFGAVSVLLVEAAVVAGPRAGVAAGMGVATADLAFAGVATAAGGAAGAALADNEAEIRIVAAAVLAAIAVRGLLGLRHTRGPAGEAAGEAPDRSATAPGGHYLRFLAITSANPLSIASFAAVATSLSLHDLTAAASFAVGVGIASAGWHLALTLAAGHAARWISPRVRRALAVGGRLAILGIAAHLILAA